MDLYEFLEIVLKNWGPPIISVLVGGLLVSILVPRWQVRFEKSRQYDKRRLELLEGIAKTFPLYVANWRRLIDISFYEEQKGQLSQEEQDRKLRFVADRNTVRDKLFSSLSSARIYFSDSILTLITEFSEWDEKCTILELDELPQIQAWQEWELKIIRAMMVETLMAR